MGINVSDSDGDFGISIDFDIDIDIYTKVLVSSSLTFTAHLAAQTAYGHHWVAGRVNNCWAGLGPWSNLINPVT